MREAARGAREGELPTIVQGPIIKPPVWTWEVPLYFWFGGIAAGSSFVALACDLAGDERSARGRAQVALGALGPSPPLLIADLGRPERFLNMLRIFKPRSPMSMGAWCLTVFGDLAAARGRRRPARRGRAAQRLGAANAVLGGYLGSYTGVLLASTAVPLWARCACSSARSSSAPPPRPAPPRAGWRSSPTGLPPGHPTREALGRVETGRDGRRADALDRQRAAARRARRGLEQGPAGHALQAAKWSCAPG